MKMTAPPKDSMPPNPPPSIRETGNLERTKKLEELSRKALKELKQVIIDYGPCDHSVGICICDLIRLADQLDEALGEGK